MSGESDTLWLPVALAGFMAAGCKTEQELGLQSGSYPHFGVHIVRDGWIGRLIDACQVKAPQTDLVLNEVLFAKVRQLAATPSRS